MTSRQSSRRESGRQANQPARVQRTSRTPAGPVSDAALTQRALADPSQATPAAALAVQRTAGNRAANRIFRRPSANTEERPDPAGSRGGGELSPDLTHEITHARGGGRPLDERAAGSMGQALGADFSGVRVHNDARADNLNRSINARAFTVGSDIFFSQGAYSPGSGSGQKLLAHELTHVAQQGAASTPRVQGKLNVGPANDAYEQEADRVADQAVRGAGRVQRLSQTGPRVQRGIKEWWARKKRNKLKTKYTSTQQSVAEETEKNRVAEQDKEAEPRKFKLSIAVAAGSMVRSNASISENGHGWVEAELLRPFNEVAPTTQEAMTDKTQDALRDMEWHTAGFYPNIGSSGGTSSAMTASAPGIVMEPERSVMLANTDAKKSFMATDDQAKRFFAYIKANINHRYSFRKYNCTHFAVAALAAAGFSAPEFIGTVTTKRIVAPNKVYKRLYERAALGDKSVSINKELYMGQKHISDRSDQALRGVGGAKSTQLEDTEDLAHTEGFEKISETLTASKRAKQDMAKLVLAELMPRYFDVEDLKGLRADEKRTLRVMFPQTFTTTAYEEALKGLTTEDKYLLEKLQGYAGMGGSFDDNDVIGAGVGVSDFNVLSEAGWVDVLKLLKIASREQLMRQIKAPGFEAEEDKPKQVLSSTHYPPGTKQFKPEAEVKLRYATSQDGPLDQELTVDPETARNGTSKVIVVSNWTTRYGRARFDYNGKTYWLSLTEIGPHLGLGPKSPPPLPIKPPKPNVPKPQQEEVPDKDGITPMERKWLNSILPMLEKGTSMTVLAMMGVAMKKAIIGMSPGGIKLMAEAAKVSVEEMQQQIESLRG